MQILCYDDITGDGAKHQLITMLKIGGVAVDTTKSMPAKWFQATMQTAAGETRIGSSAVSATNGIPIGIISTGQFAPTYSMTNETYFIEQLYVIIASGDVLSFARAV